MMTPGQIGRKMITPTIPRSTPALLSVLRHHQVALAPVAVVVKRQVNFLEPFCLQLGDARSVGFRLARNC